MAEKDKKYYWLKVKRDFFKRHDIQIIEDMPNGKDYILFYLKLLCESVDHEGNLRFSEEIPYNEQMLATITRTNIDVVRSAIKIFTQLNMMEIFDDGTYYMNEVQKMLGSETYWANQKRLQREQQKQLDWKMSNESPTCPSKSIEKDKELEKDIYTDVLDYWNSKNIIKHKMNDSIAKQIEKTLKEYNFNQITLYIDRYSQVISDNNYFFSTKWTLVEFLKQKNAMNDFKDDGSKWVNYCSFLNNSKGTKTTNLQSNYGCESEEI